MPKPQLSFIPLAHRQILATQRTQDRFSGTSLDADDPRCECSVTTVLAKLRKQERPFCSDLPWRCPKNLMKR